MKYKITFPFHILAKPIGPICNLSCDYCYYIDKKEKVFPEIKNFKISDENLENFIKIYIHKQPEILNEINFAWQGGEPTLLGIEFYKKVLRFQNKYNENSKKIINSLQTNGTLLDDKWGKFLSENNFLVGISIDGPEEIHNKFRKNSDKQGSFRDVMKGIEILKRYNIDFNILTVVNSYNCNFPLKIYKFLKKIGGKHIQFIPMVDKKYNCDPVPAIKWGEFLNNVFDIWRINDIGNIYIQHFEMMLGISLGYPSTMCVHSKKCGNLVALEHNGNVYSCDHFVYPQNYIGNINRDDFSQIINSNKQKEFGNNKFDLLSDYCMKCEYLEYCYGGCLAHRFIKTPDNKEDLNYLCEGYKNFYKHTKKYFIAFKICIERGISLEYYTYFLNSDNKKYETTR